MAIVGAGGGTIHNLTSSPGVGKTVILNRIMYILAQMMLEQTNNGIITDTRIVRTSGWPPLLRTVIDLLSTYGSPPTLILADELARNIDPTAATFRGRSGAFDYYNMRLTPEGEYKSYHCELNTTLEDDILRGRILQQGKLGSKAIITPIEALEEIMSPKKILPQS